MNHDDPMQFLLWYHQHPDLLTPQIEDQIPHDCFKLYLSCRSRDRMASTLLFLLDNDLTDDVSLTLRLSKLPPRAHEILTQISGYDFKEALKAAPPEEELLFFGHYVIELYQEEYHTVVSAKDIFHLFFHLPYDQLYTRTHPHFKISNVGLPKKIHDGNYYWLQRILEEYGPWL